MGQRKLAGKPEVDFGKNLEAFFSQPVQCSFEEIGNGGSFTEENGSCFADFDLPSGAFEEFEFQPELGIGDLTAKRALRYSRFLGSRGKIAMLSDKSNQLEGI